MKTTKLVLVSYPLEGNLLTCLDEIQKICINVQRAKYIPVAPQIFAIADKQNTDEQVRKVVLNCTKMCLSNMLVNELWMYGSVLTRDMIVSVRLASRYKIPIVPKSEIALRIFMP
ncbi:MAG: hypothetical protein UV60_C0028G0005 [Parcubacteria group bacterium GW2011_GWA2_43_11]|nr:MAG: hypothetical protein UU89_C0026G0007 [Parcubacteria group bacterium GW2011_GWC2_42_11]KKS84113.1 MAG: hypothetical protein UV60_C0028G0005 [Parcubacteria group bacterium GW2011_GWA2_43_11]